MLPPDDLSPNLTPGPPLYSKRAVLGFSVLFTAIAGGLMMAQNLRDEGQPAAARTALWGSVGYTVLLLWLTSFLPDKVGGTWLPLLVGYVGAMGLENYAGRFLSNRDSHPAKSIRNPLLICLVIFIPLIAAFIYLLVIGMDQTGDGHFAY